MGYLEKKKDPINNVIQSQPFHFRHACSSLSVDPAPPNAINASANPCCYAREHTLHMFLIRPTTDHGPHNLPSSHGASTS